MSNRQLTLSRELRKNETDSERLLWSRLRNKQLGSKFRRQQPIGNYIIDFVNLDKMLIIEVDGGQHSETKTKEGQTIWNPKVLRY